MTNDLITTIGYLTERKNPQKMKKRERKKKNKKQSRIKN